MLTGSERRTAIAGGAIGLAAIVLFIGLATMVLLTFQGGAAAPSVLTDPYIVRILRFTLLQAFLSTLLSILFAIPLSLALARQRDFVGRVWMVRLLAVPMGLPVLIGALGLVTVWGRQGIANQTLAWLGLDQPVSIYGLAGILIAHVFFNLPLACRLMLIGLERIPGEYWLMSSALGMRSLSVFRFIEWPVLRRLIPGIAGLVFMLCATSFTLVLTLGGGPAATTLEVAIYQSLRFDFDPPRAVALALMQIVVTALIIGVMTLFAAPDDQGVTVGRRVRRLDGTAIGPRVFDTVTILATLVFLGLPLLAVVLSGLKADLARLLFEPIFLRATVTSLTIALSAGLLSVILSMAIVRATEAARQSRGAGMTLFSAGLAAVSSLVLLVPPVVLASGWFLLLLPTGNVAVFAPALVVGINALMALPFASRLLAPAFTEHRIATARLAASLGIGGWARFRLVDWPGLRKPLLMALSFAMALSLGDLGAVALFGADELVTLPWLVYSRMGSYRTSDADGLALLLGLVCLVLTIAGTPGARADDRTRR